jgi:hypothetical protein
LLKTRDFIVICRFSHFLGGKGGSFLSGLGGIGGSSDSYGSYDNSHGHDSYSSGGASSHHGGYSRSFLDEAEVKVNSMIEAATKFFEGDEEPAKTQ